MRYSGWLYLICSLMVCSNECFMQHIYRIFETKNKKYGGNNKRDFTIFKLIVKN